MASFPARPRRVWALFVSAVVIALAAGCSETRGGDQGFISGSGTVTIVGASERSSAPEVSGETLDGDQVALSDYRGHVVVVNVWGSWCPPCRSEAPELAAASRELRDRGVRFLGIDVKDNHRANAEAFVRQFDIPYPSIYDPDGSTLLGFRDTLPPDAIPSTLVIDQDGRVAARVLGEVTKNTVRDLVDEVVGET